MGSGHADLTAFLHGDGSGGTGGVAASYERRVRGGLAAFGEGWAGGEWGGGRAPRAAYGAFGGLRLRF